VPELEVAEDNYAEGSQIEVKPQIMATGERILVIEDERQIAELLRRGLIYEGYSVEVARDGEVGLEAARDRPPDLVLLDLMLPGIDGLTVCKRLRAASSVPILVLTAKEAVPDRVAGLDAGADDYMVKPFNFDELSARVRALLRRGQPQATLETLTFADLKLNPATYEVFRGDRRIELTAREFELLTLLMQHPRQVLTRDVLYDRIWGYDFGGESNIIEVYIRYLRAKLEEGGEPRLIQTVRGVGYALRLDDVRKGED
jgi:two-component system response regulator MprA